MFALLPQDQPDRAIPVVAVSVASLSPRLAATTFTPAGNKTPLSYTATPTPPSAIHTRLRLRASAKHALMLALLNIQAVPMYMPAVRITFLHCSCPGTMLWHLLSC
jgi:hypothetical protein